MDIAIRRLSLSILVVHIHSLCPANSSALASVEFQPITQSTILPPGTKAARPDTLLFADKFYVAYLQLAPHRTFCLLILDKNLKLIGTSDLFTGRNQPTDIRICKAPSSTFFYAFETTHFQKGSPNHLNVARYRLTQPLPTLAAYEMEVAAAMPVIIPNNLPRPGDDLLDDPTPFFYRDRFYVVTRRWESTVLKVRSFSADLKQLGIHELDLSKAFPGFYLSVNSLVEIKDKLYLIAGLYNGPPTDLRCSSYIAAIQIDKSMMATIGQPIVLSKSKQYQWYVACARYAKGILFVGHDVLTDPNCSEHKGVIRAFDPTAGFLELDSLEINSGRMIDNHFTFEILNNVLYVFYQTPENDLQVKLIALCCAQSDQPRVKSKTKH